METQLAFLLLCLPSLPAVQISYRDICGNKLHDSCPETINTKIIGGTSTCAEKVPWNVLVEKVEERRADGRNAIAPRSSIMLCIVKIRIGNLNL